MPVERLPENPSLENLRKQARGLLKAARAGDAGALERLREFHPQGEAAVVRLALAGAQLVVARSYGFASWPKLRRHMDSVASFGFDPTAPVEPGPESDAFVRLACLDYGHWAPAHAAKARGLLAADPRLSRSDIFAAAAAGDVESVRGMLDADPGLARRAGGPFGWAPLLYACYSRLDGAGPGYSTLETARLLLERGADANAGFLWRGNIPPFTALTGAFGEGEGGAGEPPHPHRDELARLLLEAGADPNDEQTLYNRHFREDDGHLKLLFEYGLGKDRGGPWFERFGDRLASPAKLLVEELWSAARRNFPERVRLLVEHGADVNAPGRRDGRTAWETAVLVGNAGIAEYLVRHGARPLELPPADAFQAACMAGRREEALALLGEHPGLREELGHHGRVRLVHRAVEAGRLEGVRLLAELGFELSDTTEHDRAGINLAVTPLHNAAWMGNLGMVRLLVELGADRSARDATYGATPQGWAEHNGQQGVAEFLAEAGRLGPKVD